ncbi:hypothetical protein ABW21_db0200377 [Orbilia brochopaga]|nr:hypothetical protein ABW21_db0200377 [Drechslerella brochopaga]
MSGTNTPLVTYPNSYSSSFGETAGNPLTNAASDPTTPYSLGGTPPSQSALAHKAGSELYWAHSMSSSPEQHHNHGILQSQFKRSTGISNITGGIARALTAQGGLGAVITGGLNGISSSPPTRRLRSSLTDLTAGNLPIGNAQQGPAVSWAPENQYHSRTRASGWNLANDETEDDDQDYLIDLQLHHLEHFDDEGAMNVPLLDNSKHKSFRHYRETYAEMLYTWDLPLQRLEVLKFNGLKAFNDANLDKLDAFSRKQDKLWEGLGSYIYTDPSCG